MQERYVTWQGELSWRLSRGLAVTAEVKASANARVLVYILRGVVEIVD
jgi:hypothetical protein